MMFVSAGVYLKFHNLYGEYPEEGVYQQNKLLRIKNLSWSKDNGFITLVSENGHPEIISLRDLNNIRNVHTVSAISNASALSFQKNTKRFIGMATNSGQVALYDTKNKCISKLFQSVPSLINCLDFNIDDDIMAVACTNGNVLLYNINEGEVRETYTTLNTSSPTVMECDLKDKHILSVATEDGAILQWDINAGVTTFGAQIHEAPVCGLGFFSNPNLIVSVGKDHKFCIHDLNKECVFRSNHQYPLTAADVSPDNRTIAIGTETGHVYVYDIRKLIQPLKFWKSHNGEVNKILFEHNTTNEINRSSSFLHKAIQEPLGHEFLSKTTSSLCENLTNESTIMPCAVKYANSKDGELLSNKLNHPTEVINLNSLKNEFMSSIHKVACELQHQLIAQTTNLHGTFIKDFETIDAQIEKNWNLLNISNAVSGKNVENKCATNAQS